MPSTPLGPIFNHASMTRAGMTFVPLHELPGRYCENSGAVIHMFSGMHACSVTVTVTSTPLMDKVTPDTKCLLRRSRRSTMWLDVLVEGVPNKVSDCCGQVGQDDWDVSSHNVVGVSLMAACPLICGFWSRQEHWVFHCHSRCKSKHRG